MKSSDSNSAYKFRKAMDSILTVSNIHKSFNQLKVLKGIDLSLPQKRIATIVGPSGAGKTTFLQILGTLLRPDQGKVFISGNEVTALPEKEQARFRNREIGFVFQFHHLLPEFTALENTFLPALIHGIPMDACVRRAKELLQYLSLADRLDHKPMALSGGEQQRVAVARALMNDPPLILADEPSGNLDSENREELHALFFRLRDELGKTFIIVTHDLALAEQADLMIRMEDGIIRRVETL